MENRYFYESYVLLVFLYLFLIGGSQASDSTMDVGHVADEVLVVFQPGTTEQQYGYLSSQYSLRVLKNFNHINTRLYRLPPNQDLYDLIGEIQELPFVVRCEPNLVRSLQAVPADPKFSEQWSLHNTAQVVNGLVGPADIDIDWPEAMNAFAGTEEVVVAVVDTGVDGSHPELLPKFWFNETENPCCNGLDDDLNGYVDDFGGWDFFAENTSSVDADGPLDEMGHGSLVASIISGSANNSIGGVGVAPIARVMALRVLNDFGQGSYAKTSDLVEAFTYAAENGARIINASLGSVGYSLTEELVAYWLDLQGVLLVAAAGNGGGDFVGDDNDVTPIYPASYWSPGIISVAAIDRSGRLANFSNYGATTVDLAAPGTDIFGVDISRSIQYRETFELGSVGWTQGHFSGSSSLLDWTLWDDALGDTWLTDSVSVLSNQVNYYSNTASWVASPYIPLPNVGPQLTYNIDYYLAPLDHFEVQVTENGLFWDTVDYVFGNSVASIPSSRSLDLSKYTGQQVKLRFVLYSDSLFESDGVAIDDLEITGVDFFGYDGSQYQYGSGTSFAAPLVSGVAALIMSQRPDLSHHQVRSLILDNTDESTELDGKAVSGGVLNANKALRAALVLGPTLRGYLEISQNPICAMVLASGKYMFSCDPAGVFELTDLPKQEDGSIKLQIYADGFRPVVTTVNEFGEKEVVMTQPAGCPSYNNVSAPNVDASSAGRWVDIAGKVVVGSDGQIPICAMVLANGQHMFSCGGFGEYNLRVPLDSKGQIKLQVYADGFAPHSRRIDESSLFNVVRMTRDVECE